MLLFRLARMWGSLSKSRRSLPGFVGELLDREDNTANKDRQFAQRLVLAPMKPAAI